MQLKKNRKHLPNVGKEHAKISSGTPDVNKLKAMKTQSPPCPPM